MENYMKKVSEEKINTENMLSISPTSRFKTYSNLARSICDSKLIESKVDYKNNNQQMDYIDYRYLDALARMLAVKGDCTAVFVNKCKPLDEKKAILKTQMEATFYNVKSRIDLYRDRTSNNITEWEKSLDDEISPKDGNNISEDTLSHLQRLENNIIANCKENEGYIIEKLANEKQKWEIIQIVLNKTLYVAYNSTINDKKTKNVIKNIMEGINQSISLSDHTSLVKIAFLTNKKFSNLLTETTVAMKLHPHLVKTTTEVYQKSVTNLRKEVSSCYVKFEKDAYPIDDVKRIPYDSIEKILLSNWIAEEPFKKLRRLSLRIFQDATKLYAKSQEKEKWISLNNYEIVQNTENFHAEIALAIKIREFEYVLQEKLSKEHAESILPYIGISKLCCPLCHYTLDLLGVNHLGTHNILYAGENVWKLCEVLQADHKNELATIIKNHLISQIPNLQSNLETDKVFQFNHKLDPEISDDDDIENGIIIDDGYLCKTLKQIKENN